jgi:hypothetical protein
MKKAFLAGILLAGCSGAALWGQTADGEAERLSENVAGLAGAVLTPGAAAKFFIGLLHDQGTDEIPEWRSGGEGLERRAQWRLATHVVRSVTEYEAARLRGTAEYYERCRCKGFPQRSRHAVISEFVERRADGSLEPPVARLAGIYASVAVTAPLLPRGYGVGAALSRANMTVLTDIGYNVLQEFWPEIRRTLLLRRK